MTSNTAAVLQSGNLFVYVMHNPVMFIDPSGLSASTFNPLLGGTVGGSSHHPLSAAASREATGTNAPNIQDIIDGLFDVDPNATDDQRRQLERAIRYLLTCPTASWLIEKLLGMNDPTELFFVNNFNTRFDNQLPNRRRRIYWDPTAALVLGSGYVLSPAIGLAHEMAHALQDMDERFHYADLMYIRYTLEPEVLLNWEIPISKFLQGFYRKFYGDAVGVVRVNTSTDWGHATPPSWSPAHLIRLPRWTFTHNLNPWTPY